MAVAGQEKSKVRSDRETGLGQAAVSPTAPAETPIKERKAS